MNHWQHDQGGNNQGNFQEYRQAYGQQQAYDQQQAYGQQQAYDQQPAYDQQQAYGQQQYDQQAFDQAYGQQAYDPHAYQAPDSLPPGLDPEVGCGGCEYCGAYAPTKDVTFTQNVGALVVRFHKTVSGHMCRECIGSQFWSTTTITALFGWFGVISFFVTLFAVPANIFTYLSARSLPRSF